MVESILGRGTSMSKDVEVGNCLVGEGIRCWYSMCYDARGEGDG